MLSRRSEQSSLAVSWVHGMQRVSYQPIALPTGRVDPLADQLLMYRDSSDLINSLTAMQYCRVQLFQGPGGVLMQVKYLRTWHEKCCCIPLRITSCSIGQDAPKMRCTLLCVSALHYTALHCTALNYSAQPFTALPYCTELHYLFSAVQSQCTVLHKRLVGVPEHLGTNSRQ